MLAEVPVQMAADVRASTLHSDGKSIYYAYKMPLSLFTTATRRPPPKPDGPDQGISDR